MSKQKIVVTKPEKRWGYQSLSIELDDALTRVTIDGTHEGETERVYTSIFIDAPSGYEWLRGTHCLAAVVTEVLHGCTDGAALNRAIQRMMA